MHHGEQLVVPEPVAAAALEANLRWPQMSTCIAAYATRQIVDLVANREVHWESVVFAEPSEAQNDEAMEAVRRAHAAFGINWRHEADTKSAATHVFTDAELRDVSVQYVPPFVRASADFAAAVIPGVMMVPNDTPVFANDHNTPNVDEVMTIQYEAAAALLESDGRHGTDPSPELVAFQGLCRALHSAMNTRANKRANELSRDRSDYIRIQHAAGRHSHTRREAGVEIARCNRALANMSAQAVAEALPAMEMQTGITLPMAVGDRFLAAFFQDVTVPRPREQAA